MSQKRPPRGSGPGARCYTPGVSRAAAFAGLPRFGRGALIYFLVIALLNMIVADQPIAARLTLGPGFLGGELWQPLSAAFLFPDGRQAGVLGTLLVQWILGSPLERRWGAARYLGLCVGAGVFGHLVLALVGLALPAALAQPVGGSIPGDMAALVAFGVVFGRRQFDLFGVFPFTGRSLAALAGGLALVAPLLRGDPWPVIVPTAAAMLLAFLVVARPWRRGPASGKLAKKRKRDHLRVIH